MSHPYKSSLYHIHVLIPLLLNPVLTLSSSLCSPLLTLCFSLSAHTRPFNRLCDSRPLCFFVFYFWRGAINSCCFCCSMLCAHSRLDSVVFVTPQPTWCGLLVRQRRVHLLLSPWERTSRLSACLQKISDHTHTHVCVWSELILLACLCRSVLLLPNRPSHRDTLISWDRWGAGLF